MKLPISFEQVSYFNNEYRGDLIITRGVLYYFPHTRVIAAKYSNEIGGQEAMVAFDLLGNLSPIFGAVPWLRVAADKSIKIGKFMKRNFRPTMNSPQIKKLSLWNGSERNEELQNRLDQYIKKAKLEPLKFAEDSIPKPMRFEAHEIENAAFGLKFKFDAKFDNHDFKVHLFHRKHFRAALREGSFLR